MRVRFRRPMRVVNPEFNSKDHICAKKSGIPYRIQRHMTVPAGTEWDHPSMTVLLKQGIADPVDDEAKVFVSHWDEQTLRDREEGYDLLEKGMATGDPFYDNESEDDDDERSEFAEIPDDAPLQELGD